jgi:hypothetical protein
MHFLFNFKEKSMYIIYQSYMQMDLQVFFFKK